MAPDFGEMMAFHSLRWMAEAEAELRDALDWYDARSAVAASEFLEDLGSALTQIESNAARGSPHLKGTRRRILQKFPFSVVYRATTPQPQIIAIAHAKRRPGYWIKRLKN
jgi:plasmid stabilization system protein ParE